MGKKRKESVVPETSVAAEFVGQIEFLRVNASVQTKIYFHATDLALFRIELGLPVAILVRKQLPSKENVVVACGIAWSSDKLKKRNVFGLSTIWEPSLIIRGLDPTQQQFQVVALEAAGLPNALSTFEASNVLVHKRFAQVVRFQVDPAATQRNQRVIALKERQLLSEYVRCMLLGMTVFENAVLALSLYGKNVTLRVLAVTERDEKQQQQEEKEEEKEYVAFVYLMTNHTRVELEWSQHNDNEENENPQSPGTDRGLKAYKAEQDTTKSLGASDLAKTPRSFDAIGGLSQEIRTLRQVLEQPLLNPQLFERFGLPPPKGALLFGPPGTGKTLLARTLASHLNVRFFVINGPELVSKFVGESEANLRQLFEKAVRQAPSLVFLDEIDAICPRRDGPRGVSDLEKRLVTTLLTLLDGLDKQSQVVVLGATNRPHALDPAIRRPGRFDREIEISIPNAQDRLDIMQKLVNRMPHQITLSQLEALSGKAHGFVGADLAALVKEAALVALKRGHMDNSNRSNSINGFELHIEDLQKAMASIKPSALREISIDIPQVHWEDIGGQGMIKQQMKEAVEWPLQHPQAFVRMGIRPPKGVLLYGPPGCSKTLTAKALATESSMNFIAIKGPELYSKWVGESEKAIHSLFKKARAASPCVVFFDEIDAIASQRASGGGGGSSSQVADRVLSQLLTEMDGIEVLKQVLVVAATNRPDLIDKALLRPGRIDRVLYVGPPDQVAREEILGIHSRKIPLAPDVDLKALAAQCDRFSGAELFSLCREAAMLAIEEDQHTQQVSQRHFLQAKAMIRPQITDEMLAFFDNFQRRRSG